MQECRVVASPQRIGLCCVNCYHGIAFVAFLAAISSRPGIRISESLERPSIANKKSQHGSSRWRVLEPDNNFLLVRHTG
jgi:hypothetical protein